MKYQIVTLLITMLLSSNLFSQEVKAEAGDDIVASSMQDLSIVVGVGVGGAILGLSTLSFVDEPKEHFNNVVMGASLGIIIGVGIVAYNQATKSKDSYLENARYDGFNTSERFVWHRAESSQLTPKRELPLLFKNFSF